MKKILIVEDEHKLAKVIQKYLQNAGLPHNILQRERGLLTGSRITVPLQSCWIFKSQRWTVLLCAEKLENLVIFPF
jgi:hypothetical protein